VTDHDKLQRGIDARALLEAPLIIEAFARLETDTVDDIARSDRTDMAKMGALAERLRVIRDLRQYLVSVDTTAKSVEYRLNSGQE
jgi:hypothetical protein